MRSGGPSATMAGSLRRPPAHRRGRDGSGRGKSRRAPRTPTPRPGAACARPMNATGTFRLHLYRVRHRQECGRDAAALGARLDNDPESRAGDRGRRAGPDHPPATGEAGDDERTHVARAGCGAGAARPRVRAAAGRARRESWRRCRPPLPTATDGSPDLLGGAAAEARTYRLTFETGAYFAATRRASFYPRVEVTFAVTAPAEHHHVPLLLSPFGYSTYRGS